MDSNSENSNVVFIGGDSLSPAGHNIMSREGGTRSIRGKKVISVKMGSPREINLSKANPLRQQEVRDAFYKKEKRSIRPLAKYEYDEFGSMINNHRQKGKKPTVQKYI